MGTQISVCQGWNMEKCNRELAAICLQNNFVTNLQCCMVNLRIKISQMSMTFDKFNISRIGI